MLHEITLIGEAAKRLSASFRAAHPAIPWSVMARMRDVLIHHYDRVNLDEAWRVVTRDLPELRAGLVLLLPKDEPPA